MAGASGMGKWIIFLSQGGEKHKAGPIRGRGSVQLAGNGFGEFVVGVPGFDPGHDFFKGNADTLAGLLHRAEGTGVYRDSLSLHAQLIDWVIIVLHTIGCPFISQITTSTQDRGA